MKKLVKMTVTAALLTQNLAFANRVDEVVNSQVSNVQAEIDLTRRVLFTVESELVKLESEINNIDKNGNIAKYITIGLASTSIALSGLAYYYGKSGGEGAMVGGLFYGGLAAMTGIGSSISHLTYRLQRKQVDQETATLEIDRIRTEINSIQAGGVSEVNSGLQKLSEALLSLQKEINNGSNLYTLNNVSANTTYVLNALAAGVAGGIKLNLINSRFTMLAPLGAALAALPALISSLSDDNKENVLKKIVESRKAVSEARLALEIGK